MEQNDNKINSLFKSKSFRALTITQFLGVLNDNIFKLVVSMMVTKYGAMYLSIGHSLFILPFILLSFHAGILSDKFPKPLVIKGTKALEIVIMSLAAFFFIQENFVALFILLFFMGLQSTYFSPAKYGILPELLDRDSLTKGNGYIELFTFSAILLGTALSGYIATLPLIYPGIIAVSISVIGFITSLAIKHEVDGKVETQRMSVFELKKSFIEMCSHRGLYLTLLGTTYFWFIGALFQLNIFLFADRVLGLDKSGTGFLITIFSVGIGLGSIFAGKVSTGKVDLGLIPIGAFGIALSSCFLSLISNQVLITYFLMFFLGFFSGIFLIPLNSYLQLHSPEKKRGRYISLANILHSIAMLFSAIIFWTISEQLNFSPKAIFLFIGILSLISTIYIIEILPETLIRCINWLLIHSFYKLKTSGTENIPTEGGALLVSNHVSLVDASLILATTDRSVRFLMFKPIYDTPIIKFFSKAMGAIPIAGGDLMTKEEKEEALQKAKDYLAKGELVGIFAEGAITTDGQIQTFKKGYEKILEDTDAKIIPIKLDGLWGSIFSKKGSGLKSWIPKKIPYPLSIRVGESLSPSTKAEELQKIIEEL